MPILKFNPSVRAIVIPEVGVLLLSEKNTVLLEGEIVLDLAFFIDMHSTDEVILAKLTHKYGWLKSYYLLTTLQRKKYLIDSDYDLDLNSAAYWSSVGAADLAKISRRLKRTVTITTVGNLDPACLQSQLEGYGIQIISDSKKSDLNIVLTTDYLLPEIEKHAHKAIEENKPWVLAKPNGVEFWIGPLFFPGKRPCFFCLRQRLKQHQMGKNWLLENISHSNQLISDQSSLPTTLNVAYNMLTTEIVKYFVAQNLSSLEGKVLSVNSNTWDTRSHVLRTDFACPICKEPSGNYLVPMVLKPEAIINRMGGYRTQTPEAVFKKNKHLLSPITGLAADLIPQNNDNIFVYSLSHNWLSKVSKKNSKQDYCLQLYNLRRWSGGKGITKNQAKVSALGEAIERYCATFQGGESQIQSSFENLSENAIDPTSCMQYSVKQYQNREILNQKKSRFNPVPEPFDYKAMMGWTPIWSLTDQKYYYLPSEYLYFQYHDQINSLPYCYADSNGNAAGCTLEEAILQGLLELIERDSVALWWYSRSIRPAVDISSFNEPKFEKLINNYKKLNREIWALDLTSDLNIPTIVAISRERDNKEYICFGFGCHLDPKIALERALTEMNQMLNFVDHVKTSHLNAPPAIFETTEWLNSATISEQFYLLPSKQLMVQFSSYIQPQCSNLLEAIEFCQKKLEDKHMKLYVLDQTHPGMDLKVVKVVVPGLRSYFARYAPGRLYDIPYQMGWTKQILLEEELNPIPMFL